MLRRVFVSLLLACSLISLFPPFFTNGACNAEFDATTAGFQAQRAKMGTLSEAQAYLAALGISCSAISAELCKHWPLRDAVVCPGGPVLLAALPVKNRICRYYRDSSIRLQLGFNEYSQLVRIQTDMKPSKSMRLPWNDREVYWAK
jgi:hypothetical protein